MAIPPEDRAKLISLARSAVRSRVTGSPPPKAANLSGVLGESRGCFVTLKNRGRLRGCIGTFMPQGALAEMVVEMGRAAAGDPRFVMDPITLDELGELDVEVSVLSPLEQTDHPENLDIGTHGIYIVRGPLSGCFLPEVATEMGWGVEEFLDHCCTGKAGLPRGAWSQPGTKVYLFTSEKFSE